LLRLGGGDARPVAIGEEAFIAGPAASPDGRRAILNRFDPATNSADLWMVGSPINRLSQEGPRCT